MNNVCEVLKCIVFCAMLVLLARACISIDIHRMEEHTQHKYDKQFWDSYNNVMTNSVRGIE